MQVLQHEVEESQRRARLIEENSAEVDAAIAAVREALAGGMDWQELSRVVREERKAGNPVAGLIRSLHLERSRIALLLCPDMESADEEARTAPATVVSGRRRTNARTCARLHECLLLLAGVVRLTAPANAWKACYTSTR